MAHEDYGAVQRGNGSLGDCHVIRQRNCRILDDRYRVPVLLQCLVDALPTGPVHETAVNENHVLHNRRCIGLCHKLLSYAEDRCHERQDRKTDLSYSAHPLLPSFTNYSYSDLRGTSET